MVDENIGFVAFAIQFYKKALPFSICKCFPLMINLLCYYIISLYKDIHLTTGFGLALCFYNFLYMMLNQVNAEICGIILARYIGMESGKSLNLTYFNGLITNMLVFLLSICFYIRLDLILMAMGFDQKSSTIAHNTILALFPF